MLRAGSMILIAAVLVGTAACGTGSSSGSSGSDVGAPGFGPQLTVSFDIDGAVALTGKQNAAVPSNNGAALADCAAYAKGSPDKKGRTFYVTGGLLDGPVDGKKVTMDMWIKDYRGPGTYAKDKLAAPGSDAGITVEDKSYSIWPDSTSSKATTDGKGGGVWTFTKLATTGPDGKPGATVSGTVKWTCRD
jgi:hypothetical protein